MYGLWKEQQLRFACHQLQTVISQKHVDVRLQLKGNFVCSVENMPCKRMPPNAFHDQMLALVPIDARHAVCEVLQWH